MGTPLSEMDEGLRRVVARVALLNLAYFGGRVQRIACHWLGVSVRPILDAAREVYVAARRELAEAIP
jgi:hypothetical protein